VRGDDVAALADQLAREQRDNERLRKQLSDSEIECARLAALCRWHHVDPEKRS
jgi:hypothetical protein